MSTTSLNIRRLIGLAVAVALVVAGSIATAQNNRRDQVEALAQDSQELIDENVEALSGQQKIKRAQQKISEAKKQLGTTRKLLEKARSEEKDIAKINCINDKQAAIKGFLKVAEQSYVKLKQAVSDDDDEAAKHHYTLVAVSHQKVQKLKEEADMCAGEVKRYAEGTTVDVEVEEGLEDEPGYLSEETAQSFSLPELTPYQ